MVPYCIEEYQMQLFQLHHLVKMRMMEIHNDDVTMTVGTVTAIAEVVEVVDMSIGTKTKVRPVSPVSSLLDLQLRWS